MFLYDFFFPRFCLSCNKIGTYLCPKCQNKLEYFAYDSCLYCGKKSLYGLTHPACLPNFGIDGNMSIYKYNELFKRIIKAFKYRKAIAVWEEFRLLIRPDKLLKLKNWPTINYIQPVPLHKNKFNDRGFNQAKLISTFFNQFLKLNTSNFILRNKETKPQAQITSKDERRKNIQGAFIFINKSKITNSSILLVDDLLTTGDTIKEAARVLKKNGALSVFALTLARG